MPNLGQDNRHWYGGNAVNKMTDDALVKAMTHMMEVLLARFPAFLAVRRQINERNLMPFVLAKLNEKEEQKNKNLPPKAQASTKNWDLRS